MILDIDEKDKVIGQIYKMTNTTNGKVYIGQTRSHRLNHNKYRPFGYFELYSMINCSSCSFKSSTSQVCINSQVKLS